MLINRFYEVILICLACTIIIEILIALICKVRNKKDFLNILLVNIMTNPIVVVFPYITYLYKGTVYRNILLIILEVAVVFIEGFTYKKVLKYNKINKYILSSILNISSYLLGNIISNIIW